MALKYRIALIVAFIVASIWALLPRPTVQRVTDANGVVSFDTVRKFPIREGLDLRGGMHLTLEVNQSTGTVANMSDAIDRAIKVIRTRIDQFGVSEAPVEKEGTDRIVVELPGVQDQARAYDIVKEAAYLQMQITDKTQALDKAEPHIDAILKAKGLGAAPSASSNPANSTTPGVQSLFSPAPTDTTKKPADTGAAKHATGKKGGEAAKKTAGAAAGAQASTDTAHKDSTNLSSLGGGPFSGLVQPGQMPGEYYVAQSDVPTITRDLSLPDVQAALPVGKVVRWSNDTVAMSGRQYRALYVLDQRPIITGEYIVDAQPSQDPIEGTKVDFTLSREGGRRFEIETARHIKDYMAIVLDSVVMGRPPVIESAIGTHGQITMGGKDLQAAQDLALVLRAGALPVQLKVAEVRQIGPSLGQDSINDGVRAGIIALALVVIIMLVYYRFSGLLAVGGLALYVLYTLAALAGFDAVLTLPGLAGFVLSIGIAVDANVLIFERIREELDHGKTVRLAIDDGFRFAMTAIIDSNVSTALTAAVLYQYGTGPVKGFAVTLICGILASMVTAIFVVRTFYMVWLSRVRAPQTISI
jgi:preprotein translocase subunit SecD